ncbi:gag protease polyprotein [Cucumis melo var. makuwa]|uniref:Gag protease polyprotein n=1 Tax=Cucumis melo var. makuwa TaxID=1194695 RepID=A0A5A7T1S0_CUCMM|nr:gag protease polyprotein [Cucumis melo var. makuwa]TYK24116.1 gag protease polyprotein [Cucumis melo var. makuwa]
MLPPLKHIGDHCPAADHPPPPSPSSSPVRSQTAVVVPNLSSSFPFNVNQQSRISSSAGQTYLCCGVGSRVVECLASHLRFFSCHSSVDHRMSLTLIERCRSPSDLIRSCLPMPSHLSSHRVAKEVTFEFLGFTTGLIGDSSPLLGITRLLCVSFGITRLICVSFRITRLLCVSFGIMRLICASFGITRPICASFGITRLICASDGITRLIDVRVWREAEQRGQEGCVKAIWTRLVFFMLPLMEMLPRRGARRGGRGGRGRGERRVQPEVQPVAQATDPAAPVTHADLAAIEQRFRDLIMQMREQQQPAP